MMDQEFLANTDKTATKNHKMFVIIGRNLAILGKL